MLDLEDLREKNRGLDFWDSALLLVVGDTRIAQWMVSDSGVWAKGLKPRTLISDMLYSRYSEAGCVGWKDIPPPHFSSSRWEPSTNKDQV